MPHRKWRATKHHPSRVTSGHQISCCLVFLHFLCDILSSHSVHGHFQTSALLSTLETSIIWLEHIFCIEMLSSILKRTFSLASQISPYVCHPFSFPLIPTSCPNSSSGNNRWRRRLSWASFNSCMSHSLPRHLVSRIQRQMGYVTLPQGVSLTLWRLFPLQWWHKMT